MWFDSGTNLSKYLPFWYTPGVNITVYNTENYMRLRIINDQVYDYSVIDNDFDNSRIIRYCVNDSRGTTDYNIFKGKVIGFERTSKDDIYTEYSMGNYRIFKYTKDWKYGIKINKKKYLNKMSKKN